MSFPPLPAPQVLTERELTLRDDVAARLYVLMHGNVDTSYDEDAEDAFVAANRFILARRKCTQR